MPEPTSAEALNNAGISLWQAGKLEEAASSFRQALELDSTLAAAHVNLGTTLREQGKLAEGIGSLRQGVRLAPELAESHNQLGIALAQQGNLDEAAGCFRQALLLDPDHAPLLGNLGNVLKTQGRLDEALVCYRRAVNAGPPAPLLLGKLTDILRERQEPAEAEVYLRQLLALRPDSVKTLHDLAFVLQEQGKLAEAEASLRAILRREPNFAEALSNLSFLQNEQGDPAAAAASLRRVLTLKPDDAETEYNLSFLLLAQGDFANGWPLYESRLRQKNRQSRTFPQPHWDGSPLSGRTIFLHCEQGLGDTLQFARYAPLVKQLAGRVILESPPQLVSLLASCAGIDQIVAYGTPLPDFDTYASMMSLPFLLKTTLDTIPANVPYVFADANRSDVWRRKLEPFVGFKVGIAWQGATINLRDRLRSVPLAAFAPPAEIAGVQLFSLQCGKGTEQLADLAARFGIIDLGREFTDFADTAAAMVNLDLVITVDTAVAHCAGALGVPVWTLLRSPSCFRWLRHRQDSPWYPTMRLFRQQRRGEWDEVFARVAEALRERVAARPRPLELPKLAEPGPAESLNDRANALREQGNRQEAIACYRQALRHDAECAAAHINLGTTLRELGELEEALGCLRRGVQLAPDLAEAHNQLGILFIELGQPDDATACFQQALALKPDHAEALSNLGTALRKLGNLEEAAACFRRALRHAPRSAMTHNNLGSTLIDQGKLAEAIASFREALRLRPEFPLARTNLSAALQQQRTLPQANPAPAGSSLCFIFVEEDLAIAEAALRQTLRSRPDCLHTLNELGNVLQYQGKLDEALDVYRHAQRLRPNDPVAYFNESLVLLLQGDFARGWAAYEWRLRVPTLANRFFPQPPWDGSPLAGRSILLHCEQGLGDSVQFIRYAPLVKARGGRVIVDAPRPLLPLLETCAGIDQLVPSGTPTPPCHVQAPLMSLPFLLGTTPLTVPASIPYLSADPRRGAAWQRAFQALDGFKVGIAWQGSSAFALDRLRSVPLTRFAPLARVPGVVLVSLQKGLGAEQAELNNHFQVVDVSEKISDFADLAAIIANLDLVITVDTAVAHCAGALGVPVWLLARTPSCFRWMQDREDSPWYPTLRLFRQARRGDWDDVFALAAAALNSAVRQTP